MVKGILRKIGVSEQCSFIVEFHITFKEHMVKQKYTLNITSGEKFFNNEFLVDKATGKVYGLFVDDGVYSVGLYDPVTGSVGMGQKASRKIYPRVFKVHSGYAYSVYFDNTQMLGRITRVKL